MDDAMRTIRYPVATAPPVGETCEIAEGVLWIRMPLPMTLDHVNVYALDDGDGWTVVDTGLGTPICRDAWQSILAGPLSGRPLRRVLVTHHHPDHIGLAGWLQSNHGAELLTTRTAWLYARMLSLDVQEAASAESIAFWKGAGMPPDLLKQRLSERPFNFADVLAPLPLGFSRIGAGDRLSIGGRQWRVHTGHGHAPEHATLWSEDDNLILGGDQFLPSISPNLGVYPTEPEADPVSEWIDSCRRFQTLAHEDHFVLPGHKLPFLGLPTRLEQMIENHVSALDRLEAALIEPATAVECFVPIFKREIGGAQYGLAMAEAVAHCLNLWHKGRATRRRREDGAWLYRAVKNDG